jgi:glutathione S-transferase
MVILYHCLSARSFRPLWTLEELGLPYELRMLPFPPRVAARSYLELNPLGTVPLLLDGTTRMTESAAICQYLCAMNAPTQLLVESGDEDFGAYLNFIHFGEATLTFPLTLILRYGQLEPEHRRLPSIVDDYAKWFLARLRTLEPRLAASPYLCAGRFTAADISVGYALLLAQHLGLSSGFTPAVSAYWGRLQARDAYLRAHEVQTNTAMARGISVIPAPHALYIAG